MDNTHEAIIPAEQFELVQRILETETRRPNDAETVALFAGFLYCGDCGSRLVRRSASYKGKRYIQITVNCTPFVRQYGILSNKWGVFLCQKEYQTNDIRQNSKNW